MQYKFYNTSLQGGHRLKYLLKILKTLINGWFARNELSLLSILDEISEGKKWNFTPYNSPI